MTMASPGGSAPMCTGKESRAGAASANAPATRKAARSAAGDGAAAKTNGISALASSRGSTKGKGNQRRSVCPESRVCRTSSVEPGAITAQLPAGTQLGARCRISVTSLSAVSRRGSIAMSRGASAARSSAAGTSTTRTPLTTMRRPSTPSSGVAAKASRSRAAVTTRSSRVR